MSTEHDHLHNSVPMDAAAANRGVASFVGRLFDSSDFPPRWHCGNWPPELGWMHIGSDCAIFVAYSAIPAALMLFLIRRRDVPLRGVYWLFVAFILSCGITHLLDAIMFYHPMYRLLGVMKLVTAIVSLSTAVVLIRMMPIALRLPSVFRDRDLAESELVRQRAIEAELLATRSQLEERSSQLTVRDRRLRHAMAGALVGSVSWEVETGTILWEVGVRELLAANANAVHAQVTWADLVGRETAARVNQAALEAARSGKRLAIEFPATLATGSQGEMRIRAHAGSDPHSTPLTMSGVIGVIRE